MIICWAERGSKENKSEKEKKKNEDEEEEEEEEQEEEDKVFLKRVVRSRIYPPAPPDK